MNKRVLIAAALASFCLASCGTQKYDLSDYVNEVPLFASKSEARILQLTDLHWSSGTNIALESSYLTRLVADSSPDLIFLTGDSFMLANKDIVNSLFDLLDSFKLPWAFVYGNHDEQGDYNPHYVSTQALASAYCVNKECFSDSLFGDSNFVLNLTDGSSTKWQLYGIDSNSLRSNGLSYDYDIIHADQLKWYESEVGLAASKEGAIVPSIVYMHIPLWEAEFSYRYASEQAENGSEDLFFHGGEMTEKVYASAPEEIEGTRSYPGYANSGFFAAAEDLTSTKAIFYGHDHINDFYSEWNSSSNPSLDSILLGYGLKTGHELYYDEAMMGGRVSVLHKDGTYVPANDFLSYFLSYEDLAS